MNWIKEKDRELGRLRTKVNLAAVRLLARVLILAGAWGELVLRGLTHEEVLERIRKTDFGLLGVYFEWTRRREYTRELKQMLQDLFAEEFGDDWETEILKKLRPDF